MFESSTLKSTILELGQKITLVYSRRNHMIKRLIGRASICAIVASIMATSQKTAAHQEPESVPGEYVVKLKNHYAVQGVSFKTLSDELGAFVKSTIPENNIVVVKRPVVESQKSAIKSLQQSEIVEIAEPNYIYRINRTPNDTDYKSLWGMNNTGDKDSQGQAGVAGVDIGAEQAWDIQTGSKSVVVAIIDTGTSYDNENLKDNMWVNDKEYHGQAGVDDDGNGIVDDIYGASFVNGQATGNNKDDHGHGSHCSGTIGAKGNDGKGIVGVNWNVRMMGVKFLDAQGSGTLDDAIRAIDYATKMGAKIMSNSWGGGGYSETLKQAIERANEAGALFVAAAGNESNNNDASPTYPATYDVPNVLTVAAIDNKGQIASFSNYGKTKVHVGAPGVNIVSSTLNGKLESWSGTSMATPHVSGIAALLLAEFPNMTHMDLKQRIISTARPIAGLRGKVSSGGLANAYAALTNATPPVDPNDPARWSSVARQISTDHNYKEKTKQEYSVQVSGAKQIAVYFSKFQTEANYDTVKIYDAAGKLVQTLSGSNDDTYSATIDGDYCKIVFEADESVNYYGFDVTKVAFR